MPTSPATGRPHAPSADPIRQGAQSAQASIMLELVDESGRTTGTAEKLTAHVAPGMLHRAFSVFLFDDDGRLLLQRRALGKYHSPGVWSNTCCGHPYPGEQPFVAAARRTAEELGIAPASLREAGTVRYNHPDPASGLVEQEYNHLFVGLVRQELRPDPGEVGETSFVTPVDLQELQESGSFSAWFPTVLDAALTEIRELTGDAGW
jgi:isopentenyl-diphosphate delta-isomerase